MNSYLNSHVAREHVNDLIAIAERERLGRAARIQTPKSGLTARLAAVVHRRQARGAKSGACPEAPPIFR